MTKRKWLWIAVGLAVGAIAVVTLIELQQGDGGPVADLEVISWEESKTASGDYQFTITVANRGDALGSAMIKCEIQTLGGSQYYGTKVISLSPGEVQTHTVLVDIASGDDGSITYEDCRLVEIVSW